MEFDYFYGQQSELFSFYRVPKILFTDDRFWNISTDAKLLYGILLDRMNLSARNGWMDESGKVYIIFTIDEIKKSVGCAEKKAVKMLDELEKKGGLIERKRQGLGKPNLIYVKNFVSSVERQFLNCQKNNSGTVKNTTQELSKAQGNNTDINNTDYSDTDLILSAELANGWDDDEMEKRNSYESYFREELQIPWLIDQNPGDADALEGMLNILVDVMTTKKKVIRISGEDKPVAVVKSRFMKLNNEHISYVLQCLADNTTRVKNPKAYLLAALYNAPDTIGTYFQSWVNNDMANGFI